MRSFTLIETIVTIAIFVIAMGAVAGFIIMAYRTYGFSLAQIIAAKESQRAMEKMVKEIREATLGDDGLYIIEKAEADQLIFYSNVDGDSAIERVRYFVEGSDLKRGLINPVNSNYSQPEEISILASDLRSSSIFSYSDGNRLIEINLTINSRPPLTQDFVLKSKVLLRNLAW